jgi:hypothetical protein
MLGFPARRITGPVQRSFVRRLVIELYGRELERRIANSSFQNIRSMEIVHILRNDQNEFVAIWRIRLKDPGLKIEDCFRDDGITSEVQLLEGDEGKGEDGPSYLVLLKRKPRPGYLLGSTNRPDGGYLFGPLGFRDGRLRFTFVGSQKQVKEILGNAEKRRLRYRVVSLTDADFAPDSLLNRLTEKQRRVLISAYKLGYYDVPRKINSEKLAEHLNLRDATVVEHLRKAERRLVSGILSEP